MKRLRTRQCAGPWSNLYRRRFAGKPYCYIFPIPPFPAPAPPRRIAPPSGRTDGWLALPHGPARGKSAPGCASVPRLFDPLAPPAGKTIFYIFRIRRKTASWHQAHFYQFQCENFWKIQNNEPCHLARFHEIQLFQKLKKAESVLIFIVRNAVFMIFNVFLELCKRNSPLPVNFCSFCPSHPVIHNS